ncbi:MAG: DUF222 domain-containing protein [Gordonia sp. (in: high G+C Gram-positive bacteria)]|uniref:HNH endonuclease signature motif containing protein n=1 Tax=Gordonia sp. (in: high G+C Gram-positive bacteria) TaxID=84139 RepID=UPI0039E42FEC
MSRRRKASRTPKRWRDADLTPLGLGPVPDGLADHDADVTAINQLVATCEGESYLMWRRLNAVADLLERRAPIDPATAKDSVEFTRLCDPRTKLATSIAGTLAISTYLAEKLVTESEALRHRLPHTGLLLRDGVLSPRAFSAVVFETTAVIDPALMVQIDHRIADELTASGIRTVTAVADLARRIVADVDAEAARAEREAAKKNAGVVSYPIRGGMAVLEITDTAERIAVMDAAITAAAQKTGETDTRSSGRRRANAAYDLLTGDGSGPGAKVIVNVITDRSTLEGGDKPGHLDGHGTISADHVRDIASTPGTVVRPLDLTTLADHTAQAADPYRPTALLDTVVRGLFGTCTWPGCSRPASRCQLDHVTEYNHQNPDAGGATCWCNLNPKCVFHHQIKTFADGFLDDQLIDANGHIWTEITTPEGFTTRIRAANTWLLPGLGLIPCRHGPPDLLSTSSRSVSTDPANGTAPHRSSSAPQRSLSVRCPEHAWRSLLRHAVEGSKGAEPTRTRTRTEAKHAYRLQLRAQNRRARFDRLTERTVGPATGTAFADDGPPPF